MFVKLMIVSAARKSFISFVDVVEYSSKKKLLPKNTFCKITF